MGAARGFVVTVACLGVRLEDALMEINYGTDVQEPVEDRSPFPRVDHRC
jgi:hypothetical protein